MRNNSPPRTLYRGDPMLLFCCTHTVVIKHGKWNYAMISRGMIWHDTTRPDTTWHDMTCTVMWTAIAFSPHDIAAQKYRWLHQERNRSPVGVNESYGTQFSKFKDTILCYVGSPIPPVGCRSPTGSTRCSVASVQPATQDADNFGKTWHTLATFW